VNINDLKAAVKNGRVRVTDHADEEAQTGRLTLDQVFFSLANGEVVEEYSTERPYPSWLVLGHTPEENPVHSVWGCNSKNGWAVLIRCTVPAGVDRAMETERT
jgi:hypothetical protein